MDDEAEVLSLERDFVAAWNRGDAQAAAAVYAHNGTRVGAFGDVSHGRREIEAAYARLLQGMMKGATAEWQPSVRVVAPDVAVAQGLLVIHPPGGGSVIHGYSVDIWKKRGGRWELVEGHPKLFPSSARPGDDPVASASRNLLRHCLAALAYRTQKALRHAPPSFSEFDVGSNVRTPHELLWHMTGVIGYARTMLRGGSWEPPRLETLAAEIERFHDTLRELANDLADPSLQAQISDEQFLQGPLSDAMTHAGQLAMLRRMHGSPVPSENFIYAAIDVTNVSAAQAEPGAPDRHWAPHLPPPAPGPAVKYTRPVAGEESGLAASSGHMPRYLDLERWPRRGAFEFFRDYDNPYFNVCAPLDCSALLAYTRAHDLSFSLACVYLALKTANACEPFRYRLDGGRVLVHERIHAGTTALIAEERFAFIYFDFDDDFRRLQDAARRARDAAGDGGPGLEAQDQRTDLVHFSSLPWIEFTSLSHARNWRREDSVPKITFGRYHGSGPVKIPISVEVHHALMDGVHVGRFMEALQGRFGDPARELDPSP